MCINFMPKGSNLMAASTKKSLDLDWFVIVQSIIYRNITFIDLHIFHASLLFLKLVK